MNEKFHALPEEKKNAILNACGAYGNEDLFESLYLGIRAKIELMRTYPDMGAFTLKAFYERDPEVCTDIQKSVAYFSNYRMQSKLLNLKPEQFVEGLDLQMMYQDMYWSSNGYIREKTMQPELDVDAMEKDFQRMIDFWKSIYLRKDG